MIETKSGSTVPTLNLLWLRKIYLQDNELMNGRSAASKHLFLNGHCLNADKQWIVTERRTVHS